MARGRKKNAQDGADTSAPPPLGHNENGGLTDEQRQALHFQHVKIYKGALAKKKAADAELKNAAKRAKSELGKDAVKDIKLAIDLEEPDSDAVVQADIERMLRVARWHGASVGSQFELFAGPDRTPAVDRAFAEGKRAALRQEPAASPYASTLPQNDAYLEGHAAGGKALLDAQRSDDAFAFDEERRVSALDSAPMPETPAPI